MAENNLDFSVYISALSGTKLDKHKIRLAFLLEVGRWPLAKLRWEGKSCKRQQKERGTPGENCVWEGSMYTTYWMFLLHLSPKITELSTRKKEGWTLCCIFLRKVISSFRVREAEIMAGLGPNHSNVRGNTFSIWNKALIRQHLFPYENVSNELAK